MNVTLRHGEIRALQQAQQLLLSPLAAGSVEDWCLGVNRSLQPLLGADMVSFVISGRDEGLYSDQYARDILASYTPYDRRYQQEDERWRRQVEAGVWTRAGIWPDLRVLYRSDYWEFVRSVRAYDALGMSTRREGVARPVTLFFHHERPDGPKFGRRGEELLRMVHPAFQAGVTQLDRLERRRGDLLRMLDELPDGAMLVDADGRVLHRNRALDALVAADPEGWRLEEALERLAPAVAGAGAAGGLPGGGTVLRTGRGSYGVVASRLGEDLLPSPTLLLSVTRREESLPGADRLVEWFGLTPREAEVALLLARRKTNREIARHLVISPHTARHHTERVLRKLGIRCRTAVGAVLLEPPDPRGSGRDGLRP